MKSYSILNDVIGPVMHGPSSSHTAASHRIGFLARALLGAPPASVEIVFDHYGSFGKVFRDQGSDLAFAAGLMGWDITDDRFFQALDMAKADGIQIRFDLKEFPGETHPNAVKLFLTDRDGGRLEVAARSVGGGSVEINAVDGWPVDIQGQAHDFLIFLASEASETDAFGVLEEGGALVSVTRQSKDGMLLVHAKRSAALSAEAEERLRELPGVDRILVAPPVIKVIKGSPLFESGEAFLAWSEAGHCDRCSLGEAAVRYESQLLGLTEAEVLAELDRRYEIMRQAVIQGLTHPSDFPGMRLLRPTAHKIMWADSQGSLALGGVPTRAAVRAMAAMQVNSSMGLVCAAPTGGSSGVIPGVLVTLAEEKRLERPVIIRALAAAAGVGLVILMRGGTYAAEVAGCQVEIGAAGAMAAAAVVEAVGGTARHAADAASIALQNTMGSVCDLVQGVVEIPCHTRNAVAASSAFVCADLVLGGYENPISLDDAVDASFEVGRALKPEHRCTALGGIAITPSALGMEKHRSRL